MLSEELAQRLQGIIDSQDESQELTEEVEMLKEKQKMLEVLVAEENFLEKRITELKQEFREADEDMLKKAIKMSLEDSQKQQEVLIAKRNNLEKDIVSMMFIIDKKKNFDKNILFRNIRELLKNKDVKLGQIEREAGCQPGYMSRLEKAGNTSDPSVEFVVTAAKMLDVSIDLLIKADVGTIRPTEDYMLNFLTSMIKDTISDSLTWKRETVKMLENLETNYRKDGKTDHPLFLYKRNWKNEEDFDDEVFYNSMFFPNESVRIVANCYNTELFNIGAKIYIMACQKESLGEYENTSNFYEVYLVKKGVEPICCSLQSCGAVSKTLEDLYKEIETAATHVHLGIMARNIIEEYLEVRDLPFH